MIVGIYRAVPGRWQREPGGKCGVSLLWSWVLKTWWEQSRSQFGCCFSTRGTHGGPQAFPQTSFPLLRPGLVVVHHDSQWQGPPGTFLGPTHRYLLLPSTLPMLHMKMRLTWVWDLKVRGPPQQGVRLFQKEIKNGPSQAKLESEKIRGHLLGISSLLQWKSHCRLGLVIILVDSFAKEIRTSYLSRNSEKAVSIYFWNLNISTCLHLSIPFYD